MNGYGHEENHSPGSSSACGEHGPARSLVDSALVLSGRWTVRLTEPATAGEVAQSVAVKLMALAGRLAVDGAVPGHVTALIKCGAGSAALSVTRLGTVDGAQGMDWKLDGLVRRYDVAVKVVSLLNTDAVTQTDLDCLFGGEEGAKI